MMTKISSKLVDSLPSGEVRLRLSLLLQRLVVHLQLHLLLLVQEIEDGVDVLPQCRLQVIYSR
jgi:hypothetical protein